MDLIDLQTPPLIDKNTKPLVAIGHMGLAVPDLPIALELFKVIGARIVVTMPNMAIAELRGGTHVILQQSRPSQSTNYVPFDLMVDDIDSMHSRLFEAGYDPSTIESGGIHRSFSITDKSGMAFEFTSSHAIGVI